MGQYYRAYTKNAKEELVWSLQCTDFTETRNFDWYIGVKLVEHSWYGNTLTDAMSFYLYHNPTQLAWVGDYADEAEVYEKCWGEKSVDFNYQVHDQAFDYAGKWLVNHTTKQAFMLDKPAGEDWAVYPVSIITACGNGRGGGDYPTAHKMVGVWAMNTLSIEDAVPEGYQPIENPNFQIEF